jgi:hypothetical protein
MLGYSKDDLDNATYGVRLALDALSENPPTYPKEDLKRVQGLARDGLKVAQGLLDGLWAEGYFD